MENSKRSIYDFALYTFVDAHKATPEMIQTARAIVEGNVKAVSHFLAVGLVTPKQLELIAKNNELIQKFVEMYDALHNHKKDIFNKLYEDIKDRPDLYCGWLEFYNWNLEEELQMNLIPKTRQDMRLLERFNV